MLLATVCPWIQATQLWWAKPVCQTHAVSVQNATSFIIVANCYASSVHFVSFSCLLHLCQKVICAVHQLLSHATFDVGGDISVHHDVVLVIIAEC